MTGTDLGQVVQRGLSKSKRYDPVEMRPLNSFDDEADTEKKSKVDLWLEYAWRKLHALLWIIIAGALATYLDVVGVVIHGHVPGKPQRQLHRCVPFRLRSPTWPSRARPILLKIKHELERVPTSGLLSTLAWLALVHGSA